MSDFKEFTCSLCPEHCLVTLKERNFQPLSFEGNRCSLGEEFAKNLILPKNWIFSGIAKVEKGDRSTLALRTTAPLPLDLFPTLQKELNRLQLEAPLHRGEVVVENILNTGVDLIAASTCYFQGPGVHSRFLRLIHSLKEPRFHTALCAHRGDLESAPENTMAAFHRALELEVDVIEFDVQLTKDGQVVVFHDSHLDRTTDGKGRLKDFTLEELGKFSAGEWFGEEFAPERIPTFRKVLELIKGKTLPLIEIKSPLEDNTGIEEGVFSLLLEMGMEGQAMVSTRSLEYAVDLKERFPTTWVLYLSIVKKQNREVLDTILDGVTPYWRTVSPEMVQAYHEQKKIILPWTVDNTQAMESLTDMGIDGIISNRLIDLMEVLIKKGKIQKLNPSLWKQFL